ncbi:capsular exopolysaccharide biosynthesis protein [Mycobacterium sp. JS623]|uniref:polysaccharide biosynthesis tyrosine autokinase n=1 Tax=Mycobacterium sp. JS623 TaxID=212767 RepID=UPI0002A58472|nr:polysaccharide biosynthesis tyrosine autokinase [Mycobacterium sp. JS623]AGB21358.1 capsular exopolysaccharide biosynthesis protein [Mycobacterium sp. JS623]
MNIHEFLRLLRSRWLIICATTAVAVGGAVALNALTTPLYEGSTRLFVSTTSGASASEAYQGTLFSQQRVLSYTKLLMGETLAQRTVDKLQLDMSADSLRAKVKATSAPDTVLIDVSVLDPSRVRARDIANALSDEFVVMVSELETPAGSEKPDARVVVEQHASLPASPVVPKTTRNILIALALGVLLGIGLAVLRDRFDNTLKDRQSLEETTGVGLVASIPLDRDRKKDPAISFNSDRSAIAEAFRELRTNLQFLEVDDPPRILLITGSLPSEGKSTTAINIALALAEGDNSVVLVDGDMRRPTLAEYLGLIGNVGFSTVLAGRATIHEVVQKTTFPGLSVLTSGEIPPNPSELLGSLAAKKVLSELRADFDYVIVDSSPLLAVTDAAVLAAAADGVLLICRFGKTKREQLAHAVGNLRNVGARILGAVFTMTPARGNSSYNYSYYGGVDNSPAILSRPKNGKRHRREVGPSNRISGATS